MVENIGELFLKEFVHTILELRGINLGISVGKEGVKENNSVIKKDNVEVEAGDKKISMKLERSIVNLPVMKIARRAPVGYGFRRFNFPQGTSKFQANKPVVYREGGIGLLSTFLLDPGTISIECAGPGKPVLINKSGIIQATKLILNKDQIDNIIKEVSERTRIPVISGVFKAVVDNFIITAVISEFVGTRFLIQKSSRMI